MSNKKYLIIGANSFLGYAISKKLYEMGSEVLGVYHNNTSNLFPDIPHVSISQISEIEGCFSAVFVVSAHVPDKNVDVDNKQLFDANVHLVQLICDKFKKSRIVYCSSVSVYKDGTCLIAESSDVQPLSLYAISKFWGEQIVKKNQYYAIVRIASMYGENMKINTFLPLIIKNALEKQHIKLLGSGERRQNYIHVNDVAGYLIAVEQANSNGVFLAVSEKSYSNKEIAEMVRVKLNNIQLTFSGVDNSSSYVYNNKLTKRLLNIQEGINISVGIDNLIKWMKNEL